jgi:hypothetical protein
MTETGMTETGMTETGMTETGMTEIMDYVTKNKFCDNC